MAPPLPREALYHCQQAAEKALKGFLAFHDHPFRRTHDLRELGESEAISDFIQMPVNIGPKQGGRKLSASERQNATMVVLTVAAAGPGIASGCRFGWPWATTYCSQFHRLEGYCHRHK